MRIQKLITTENFFLTDGGLETYMIFEKGHELPCFSAAVLLDSERGRSDLTQYYEGFISIAKKSQRGFVLDAPTWRAGSAWAEPLGLSEREVLEINTRAVAFVSKLREKHETHATPIVINGLVGPAGDAYASEVSLDEQEAFEIHSKQIHALGKARVDMIGALTLTNSAEAIGILKSAKEIDVPASIAFTLETDGRLPTGQPLGEAIEEVDAATDNSATYFMINCAHPDHFKDILDPGAHWLSRIGGIRANASRMSHAELDNADTLDDGDPIEHGKLNSELMAILPNIRVVGGCCGTDHRHVSCISEHKNAC